MDTGMAFDPAIAGAGLAADEMDVDAPAPDLSDGNKFCQDRSNPAHPVALDGTDVPCGPGGKDSWALCNVCKAKNVCQRCNEENCTILQSNFPTKSPFFETAVHIGEIALDPVNHVPTPQPLSNLLPAAWETDR